VWSCWRDPDILQARQAHLYYPHGRINGNGVTGSSGDVTTIKRDWIPSDPVIINGRNGEKWKIPWNTYKI
jgi:hypothetical protein